jgi:tetratricopeptide (TPR) repeat protein
MWMRSRAKHDSPTNVGGGGRGYHVYLRYKAALHTHGPYKDIVAARDHALECIKLNRPDFDLDKIPDYFLSHDELLLLNMMAVAYAEIEGIDKAIEIWFALKQNYEKQYNINAQENPRYREIVLNICVGLKNAERFEECLAIAEEGLKEALIHHEMRTHIIYFKQKAWCLMKLGRKEEGRELYKKFLMLAHIMDGYATVSFEVGKKEYEDTFGERLDLSVEW